MALNKILNQKHISRLTEVESLMIHWV